MANRRRRPPSKRSAGPARPRPTTSPPRSGRGELEHADDLAARRGSLLPTILWTIVAILGLAVLVGIILIPFAIGFDPGRRWKYAGLVVIAFVVELGLAVKAAQAFLDWKDPD